MERQAMAKKAASSEVNVSAAIREYLKANADVGATEAAAAGSKQVAKKVTPAFASNVKTSMNGKSKKKRRGRKPGRKPMNLAVPVHAARSNGSVELATIAAVKELLGRVGAN